MTTIVFAGADKLTQKLVKDIFLKKKSVIITKKEILISGNKYLINFDLSKNLPKDKAIYVFGGEKIPKNIQISDDSICICLGNDKNALCSLYNKNLNVITCGLKGTDTITFSSLDNTKLLSLQRTVNSINNLKIEPFDFTNKINSDNKETILLINSLLLILGY